MDAYGAFHNYSIGKSNPRSHAMPRARTGARSNQYLPGWQGLGRSVKRGERALTLCMPITRKVRDEGSHDSESEDVERTFKTFMYKPRWFVLSQTVGDESFRHACRIGTRTMRSPRWKLSRSISRIQMAIARVRTLMLLSQLCGAE